MFCTRCQRAYPAEYRFCPVDGAPTSAQAPLDRVRPQKTRASDTLLADRYVVRGFIGKGGMARVYLAEDVDSGEPVAVKVLEEPFSRDPQARERFLREAQAIAAIGHPHIARVLGAGAREDDGAPYLVLEFLFGETVQSFLEREGTFATGMALAVLCQAAEALDAAHTHGIIHRDVKPGNLFLVGEPGDPYELKVVDFGLSKLQTSHMTAAGIVLGTPAYMAPEQVLAEGVDARTDVYALGMVMYRMLTGRHAFHAEDEIAMVAHQLLSPLRPLSLKDAGLAPGLERAILCATRKSPDERYPTMDAMLADLQKLAAGRTDLTAPVPTGIDRYVPRTEIGELVATSLARALEADERPTMM
ncbi:MAG: serine/threonine protein kinase [Polyangiaceae bacterium]|nr:serine/threonine protein kinase [Polyangiaceae bacterium]